MKAWEEGNWQSEGSTNFALQVLVGRHTPFILASYVLFNLTVSYEDTY